MKRISTFAEIAPQQRSLQALNTLLLAIGEERPTSVQILPVIVFMAFTIEAYINNLGYRFVLNWNNKEKKSWKEKVNLLHKKQLMQCNWELPVLVFMVELFELRDRLAHGKPERVDGPEFDCMSTAREYIDELNFVPAWYKSLDSVWYSSAKEKFNELIQYLSRLYDLSDTDYLHSSTIRTSQVPIYAD